MTLLPARLRAGARIAALLAWTTGVGVCLTAFWLPARMSGRRGPQRWAAARRRVFRIWGRGTLRIVGVRVTAQGRPPPAGGLLVSNHLSYLDIVVYGALLGVVFVSKAEVRDWPIWGLLARLADTVFIDRARKRDTVRVLAEMEEAYGRGDTVIIFPEATSTDGATIRPFKSSLLAKAADRGNPVHWSTITYRTPRGSPPARDRVCWWGDMDFRGHFLGLCALDRVDCRVTYGDRPLSSVDRKTLASSLRDAMLERFDPVP